MKVLITGNMGYIGPMVVQHLRQSRPEATLLGFDIGYFAGCLTGARLLPECRLDSQFFGDVRNFPASLLQGVDAIVYLAAISNDPMGNVFEAVTLDINYRAAIDLAKKAKTQGVRSFVFASSCSVYGYAAEGARHEESSVDPLTAYARSKVYAERDLAPLADSNFNITCLRFATACGMSDRLRLDLVVNDFVASAVAAKKITILSDGTPWRPIVHIEDIGRAFLAVLHAPLDLIWNEAFNVGRSEENYRISELAEIAQETVPGCRIEYAKDAGPDKRCYRVDCSKLARTLPEFKPQWDARRGAQQLYEAYQRFGLHLEDFEGPSYKRIDHIKQLMSTGRLDASLCWREREVAVALA